LKKILIWSIFIVLCIGIYSQERYFSANGEIYFEVDSNDYSVSEIHYNNMKQKADFDGIKLGLYIDKVFYNLKDIASEINYIKNTGIIEVKGEASEIKFKVSIYAPFDANKDSVFIVSDISTGELSKSKSVSFVYRLKSEKYGHLYWNKWRKYYTFGGTYIKSLANTSNIYVGNKKNIYNNRKFDEKNTKIKKNRNENIDLISYFGKINSYDDKREIFMISKSVIDKEFVNNLPTHYILSQEINNWRYWQNESENVKNMDENTLQSLALLKMMQIEKGAVISFSNENKNTININDMLYTALAFIESGHLTEARQIFEFIIEYDTNFTLLKNIEYIDNEGFVKKINEEKEDSNLGLFLYTLARYFDKKNDIVLFRENHEIISKNILDYLYNKKDTLGRDSETLYYIDKGVYNFLKSVSSALEIETTKEYLEICEKARSQVLKLYGMHANIFRFLDKDFSTKAEINDFAKKLFERYNSNKKNTDNKVKLSDIEYKINIALWYGEAGKYNEADGILKEIENQKNKKYLIDYLYEAENAKKDRLTRLIAKYIVLKTGIRRQNGFKK